MAAQELQTLTFPVTSMTCAACASSVELMIGAQPDVEKAEVNYATQSVKGISSRYGSARKTAAFGAVR